MFPNLRLIGLCDRLDGMSFEGMPSASAPTNLYLVSIVVLNNVICINPKALQIPRDSASNIIS